MDLLLRIEFDAIGKQGFTIQNPPALPAEGEMVCFRWADYIEDPAHLAELTEFDNRGGRLFANILSRTFTRDYMEVLVVLIAHHDYYEFIDTKDMDRKERGEVLRRRRLVPAQY